MKEIPRAGRLLLLALAVLVCLGGCSRSQTEEESRPESVQSSAVESSVSESSQQASEPASAPSVTPSVRTTERLSQTRAQATVSQTVANLRSRMPGCRYDASWSGGTQVPLPIEPGLSEAQMAATLVAHLEEMFEYQSVTCVYNLTYGGVAEDGIHHTFVFSYIFEIPELPQADFDGQAVVASVTEQVKARMAGMSEFDGNGATESLPLTDVPLFYNTERAAETLTDTIVWMIQSRNLVVTTCTHFQLTYVGAGDACHEFRLNLK